MKLFLALLRLTGCAGKPVLLPVPPPVIMAFGNSGVLPPPTKKIQVYWEYNPDLLGHVEFDGEATTALNPPAWILYWRGTNLLFTAAITNQQQYFRIGVHWK